MKFESFFSALSQFVEYPCANGNFIESTLLEFILEISTFDHIFWWWSSPKYSVCELQCIVPTGQVCHLVTSYLSTGWADQHFQCENLLVRFPNKFAQLQVLPVSPQVK